MDDLLFYVILRPFNSVSAISGRWEIDNERLCAMEKSVEKISHRAGIELGPLDQ